MKYLKTLTFIIFLNISTLNASMLLDANGYCIEDFYIKNGSFYYLRSDNNTWYSTTTDNYTLKVVPNFIYQASDQTCRPNTAYILGMTQDGFHFLMALMGLIFGATFMFFTTQIFTNVGGKR